MPLPKATYPTYSTTLPSTGDRVEFRPYTVKEEKLLLMAAEGADYKESFTTIQNIIDSCTFGRLDNKKLTTFDVDHLFFNIRMKAVGETMEVVFKPEGCKKEDCKTKHAFSIDLTEVDVMQGDSKEIEKRPAKGKQIKITDNISLMVNYPSAEVFNHFKDSEAEDAYTFIYYSVVSVLDGDEVYPRQEFTKEELIDFLEDFPENSLEQLEEFATNIPVLKYKKDWVCSNCGNKEEILMEGLDSFFI